MTGVTPPNSPEITTGAISIGDVADTDSSKSDPAAELRHDALHQSITDAVASGGGDGDEVQPLSPSQVNLDVDVDAVVKIQAAIRGFLARKTYLRMRLEKFAGHVHEQVDDLFWLLQQVQQRIETSWAQRLISQTDRTDQFSALSNVVSDLHQIRAELETALNKSDASYQDVVDRFSARLQVARDAVNEQVSKAGFGQISDVLNRAVGPDYENVLSADALERINSLLPLMKPLNFGIYTHTTAASKANFIVDPVDGKKKFVNSAELREGLPVVLAPKVFVSDTDVEKLRAAEVLIPLPENRIMVIKGYFESDPLGVLSATGWLAEKRKAFLEVIAQSDKVSAEFGRQFLSQYSVRDLVANTPAEFKKDVEQAASQARRYEGNAKTMWDDFKKGNLATQVRVLSLGLMADDPKPAYMLFESVGERAPEYQDILYKALHFSLAQKIKFVEEEIEQLKKDLEKLSETDIDIKDRVLTSDMPAHAKQICLTKLAGKGGGGMFGGGGEGKKTTKWVEGVLRFPWGKVVRDPVTADDPAEKKKEFLTEFRRKLDEGVYGHNAAKDAFEEEMVTWIESGSGGAVICLEGPPGNGKTTFARDALAKALDRPFMTINFGGITDGTRLTGIAPHYSGSQPGLLTDTMEQAGVLNPVILVDEFDKISGTEKGAEIKSLMTQVLDPKQNHEVQEAYFKGVKFDFSKVIWVLTGNDLSLVGDILGDRLNTIETHGHSVKDKVEIARRFTIGPLLKKMRISEDDFKLSDPVLKYIIQNYTMEAGMRQLERALRKLVKQLTLRRFKDGLEPPFEITEALVKDILGDPKSFMQDPINSEPAVGVVAGMWASKAGLGGLGFTQVTKIPSREPLQLTHTGNQGQSMKEGMQVAKAVALSLLTDEEREELFNGPTFGLLMHTPDTSTPKDGPSGGSKNVTAIYSALTGKPVNNKVSMTGEVDVLGRVKKIGGLDMKLQGAKRAGIELALVPKENEKDLEEVRKHYPEIFDGSFDVILVEHVSEVIKHAIIDEVPADANVASSSSQVSS